MLQSPVWIFSENQLFSPIPFAKREQFAQCCLPWAGSSSQKSGPGLFPAEIQATPSQSSWPKLSFLAPPTFLQWHCKFPNETDFFSPRASPPCSQSRSYWQCIYQLSRSSRQQTGTEASCNTSCQSPARKAQHFPPGEAAGPGAEHASSAQERMQPALGLSIPPGAGSLLLMMLRGEDPSKLEGPRAESPSCKRSPAQK